MQEAELKAKRQFKGLFDKRPGEISQDLSEEIPNQPVMDHVNNNEDNVLTPQKPDDGIIQETADDDDDDDVPQRATSKLASVYRAGERLIRRFSYGKCTIL